MAAAARSVGVGGSGGGGGGGGGVEVYRYVSKDLHMLSFEIALIQAFYGLKSMPSKRSNLNHISKNRESMGMMRGSMGMMGGSMGMIKGLWVESRGLYVCAPIYKSYTYKSRTSIELYF